MANNRKRIKAVSFGFDGSIYNDSYHFADFDFNNPEHQLAEHRVQLTPNRSENRLIDENEPLIQSVASDIAQGRFNEVVTMIGSSRQDIAIENNYRAIGGSGSCFEDLPKLSSAIRDRGGDDGILYRGDSYLLADSYGLLANELAARPHPELDDAETFAVGAAREAARAARAAEAAVAAEDRASAIAKPAIDAIADAINRRVPVVRVEGLRSKARPLVAESNRLRDEADRLHAEALRLEGIANEARARVERLHGRVEAARIRPCDVSRFGDTYQAILSGNREFRYSLWFSDDSKLTILYAQMHKLASENPEAEIVFDFYDDRRDILQGLQRFFRRNKDLIPGNVTLRMHQYFGLPPVKFAEIQGKGGIDYNFHRNTLSMVDRAGFHFDGTHGDAPAASSLANPDIGVMAGFHDSARLRAFKRQRPLFASIGYQHQEAMHGVFNLDLYLGGLKREIVKISGENNRFSEFRNALNHLYSELGADITAQVRKGVSPIKIYDGSAREIAVKTELFLSRLTSVTTQEESLAEIKRYVDHYKSKSRWRNFFKALAVVAAMAVGFVVGAGVGIAIGVGVGALTGPGAIGAGVLGMFAGASTGVMVGISAGAAATGISAAAVTGFLLFRPDEKTKALNRVLAAAGTYAHSARTPIAVEVEDGLRSSPSV